MLPPAQALEKASFQNPPKTRANDNIHTRPKPADQIGLKNSNHNKKSDNEVPQGRRIFLGKLIHTSCVEGEVTAD